MTRQIVLIGAARSGTKILREVLTKATGAGQVPYDIGFVWRYGNESVPHDVLDPVTTTPRIRRYIAGYIDRYANGTPPIVIEKTVGNALRVPFVRAVLPDAAFIHLIRDGVDVTESTCRQWRAAPDGSYLLGKVRHFPLRMLPSYGAKYAASLGRQYVARDGRVGTWGPRYPGIDGDVHTEELLIVCARQWKQSVERAGAALAQSGCNATEVRYEDLVSDPMGTVSRLLAALDLPTTEQRLTTAVGLLRPDRQGAGARALSDAEIATLEFELGPTLTILGYDPPSQRRLTHGDEDQ